NLPRGLKLDAAEKENLKVPWLGTRDQLLSVGSPRQPTKRRAGGKTDFRGGYHPGRICKKDAALAQYCNDVPLRMQCEINRPARERDRSGFDPLARGDQKTSIRLSPQSETGPLLHAGGYENK